jgi:hypothetical protein
MDCDDDEEAKVQNTKSQTEAALGGKFEILFRKKHPHVKYFVFFCNLVNITVPRTFVDGPISGPNRNKRFLLH